MKQGPSTKRLVYLLERVLVFSQAERGDEAPSLVSECVDAIAAYYGERPDVTAKRIIKRVEVEA